MISIFVGACVIVINNVILYKIGVFNGKKFEKMRITRLCNQVFEDRMSGSIRRVLHGIFNDRLRLMSEDEFFGPEGKNHPNAICHMDK